ncbi:hypothetical protein [Serratia sp. UGAL515B_01]|uniref:hypothetical protein n=1 Tax=Serratia sp. UGAL515B_01 TaxID=2986763 RepID=UPI0029548BF5|nr:hypothetical protein [Serratia sp. UGAL515B_01]WON77806.1 hypothetical protein OK023_03720 [Serratia sp. UGAL515B_01]
MYLVENAKIAFLDKGDFQDSEKTTSLSKLKPEIKAQTLPVDILICDGEIVKNRFSEVRHV